MPHRAIFALHPRVVIVQCLTVCQPGKNVIDDRLIGVEIDDIPADIFFQLIAKQIELGLIRPQDRAIGTDPMQSDCRILDEITQVSFTAPDSGRTVAQLGVQSRQRGVQSQCIGISRVFP